MKKSDEFHVIKCDKCGNEAKTDQPNPEDIFARLGYTRNPEAKKLKVLCGDCSSKKR